MADPISPSDGVDDAAPSEDETVTEEQMMEKGFELVASMFLTDLIFENIQEND